MHRPPVSLADAFPHIPCNDNIKKLKGYANVSCVPGVRTMFDSAEHWRSQQDNTTLAATVCLFVCVWQITIHEEYPRSLLLGT